MSLILINTVIDSFTPTLSGTTGIITWELCRAAKRAGAEPLVFARRQNAEPYPWPRTVQIDWPRMPKGRLPELAMRAERKLIGWQHLRQGGYCRRLAAAIRRAGVTHVPMLLQNDPEPAVYLRRQFPKAFIIHHFQNQQECRPQFRRRFAGAVNVVSACSDYTARWIESYYGLPAASVKTIYNGVDLSQFVPAESPTDDGVVISFLGRTGIEKAPDVMLRACLMIARGRRRAFSVQVCGANHTGWVEQTPYQQELESLANQLRALGVPVRMPGFLFRRDVPGEFRRAHVHVTPSRWEEPFGIVTLEAMASALATCASRTGGTPEFVGNAGLLFEKDDVEGLAAHLDRLVHDDATRNDYAARGRRQAELFPWDRAWRGFMECIHQ